MKSKILVDIVFVVLVAGAGVAAWWLLSPEALVASLEKPTGGGAPIVETNVATNGLPRAGKLPKKPGKGRKRPVMVEDTLSPQDRALTEAVQEALDGDDFKKTLAACEKALKSTNTEVRVEAIDALGWFGEEALPELTPLMADRDEDVAEAAVNAWEQALMGIDSAEMRMKIALNTLQVIADDEAVAVIGGVFSGAASEYIDSEENENRAQKKRIEVIQGLVDMIESGKIAKGEVGRELYEDITGYEWRSVEEAERYITDPENYELPEDREETAAEAVEEAAEAVEAVATENAVDAVVETAADATAETEGNLSEDENSSGLRNSKTRESFYVK